MSDIYSTISMVAYILAGVFLVGAIVVFFAVNVRGAYMELRGQNDKEWVKKRQSKVQKSAEKNNKKNSAPQGKSRIDAEGEAVTTLENGEEAGPGVYEARTTVELIDEETEEGTVKRTVPDEPSTTAEMPTTAENGSDETADTDFKITKKVVNTNTKELIRYN